jgi:hypothetical protein
MFQVSLQEVRGSISLLPGPEKKSDASEADKGKKNPLFNIFKKKYCPECGASISNTFL